MPHWSDKYVGAPYIEGEKDCAYYVELILREVFGREVRLPSERWQGVRGLSNQIHAYKSDYSLPIAAPADGCGVLMVGRGRMNHLGLYCLIDGLPYVLHAQRNAGQVTRHKLRELPNQGLTVEGFYAWR